MTVRKLLFALFILIMGILAAKYLIRTFSRRLLHRTQLKQSTSSTIEKILFYFAIILVLLFSLRIVNIPLAAFAFLGGAIAIGIGFGAQNLINNFISGFIIMGERPISVGELIQLEGVLGKVEEIGARCTRVRTGQNIHILVPNSSFLGKNITNWTLSDQRVRAKVTVGVAYGSPVREVEKHLLEAIAGHHKILKTPEPFVIFRDFGDNALIFDLYFWISISRIMEQRIIQSDLRFQIDDLFTKANIVIAFPKRDTHLSDTLNGWHMVLDPGHGGLDPGAVVENLDGNGNRLYVVEDEYVYDIALRVYVLLRLHGAAVTMTLLSPNHLIRHTDPPARTFVNEKNEVYNSYSFNKHNKRAHWPNGGRDGNLTYRVNIARKAFRNIPKNRRMFFSFHADIDHRSPEAPLVLYHKSRNGTRVDTPSKNFAQSILPALGAGAYARGQNLGVLRNNPACVKVILELRNLAYTDHAWVLRFEQLRQRDAEKVVKGVLNYVSQQS